MNISENALNALAIKEYKGIGRAWIFKHLRGGESLEQLVGLLNSKSKQERRVTEAEFYTVRETIRTQIQAKAHCLTGVVGLGDAHFPAVRGQVKNSEQPVALFYRGDLNLLHRNSRNIAVIGLLQPDPDTVEREAHMVAALVAQGAVIVSGLALGCDTVGHVQALRSGGKTVAILPSTLDAILPSENRDLADQIVQQGGLLVTEYFQPTRSPMEQSSRYQERDRLQALFSDCVVLSASYAKNEQGLDSGSRLAMGYAQNYGIKRALMYDAATDAHNPKFDLNRQFMREQPDIIVVPRYFNNEQINAIFSVTANTTTGSIPQSQGALF